MVDSPWVIYLPTQFHSSVHEIRLNKPASVRVCGRKLCSFTSLCVTGVLAGALFRLLSGCINISWDSLLFFPFGFVFLLQVFFFCLKPSVTFQARRRCRSGTWEKEGDVKEERSYFPIRDRFPYGRGRCDFILYSASALLAVPWWLNAVIWEGRTILKRFYQGGAAIKLFLWLKYWVQRSIYSVFYTYMYNEY